ncbi:hypothetical protein [Helicobacter typhlonius]|uniref:Uncharacterized protein n=1 Tax=Helicobacter typhlonius TaxID=76936 RepID=A0A0S4PYA2_9HELI|nr:Hypothetical protein BN2458_PEG1859 [Helicobacter typhlonius]
MHSNFEKKLEYFYFDTQCVNLSFCSEILNLIQNLTQQHLALKILSIIG